MMRGQERPGDPMRDDSAENFGHDHEARNAAWQAALDRGILPDFVTHRLTEAAAGRGAWVATMTPAELLL
jgi:hypothetical protein